MKKVFKIIIPSLLVLIILTSCGKTVNEIKTTTTTTTTTQSDVSQENIEVKEKITSSVQKVETTTSSQTLKSDEINKNTEKISVNKSEENNEQTTEKTKTEQNYITCTVEIDCSTVLENKDDLKPSKEEFVPESGKILSKKEVVLPQGSTAFDLIKVVCKRYICDSKCRFCNENGIHLDYSYTPAYENYYIRGIHQLYEKDCGTKSGWMYQVNGVFPNYGSSSYTLKDGDSVRFLYTCDLGDDLA